MRFAIILAAVFGLGATVSAQSCSRAQLSSCLSSRATPTQQSPSQQTPCTDVPCKCDQMSSEYGCYRMNCPNSDSAQQLNSQLAETCAPYFATKDTDGTATAYTTPTAPPDSNWVPATPTGDPGAGVDPGSGGVGGVGGAGPVGGVGSGVGTPRKGFYNWLTGVMSYRKSRKGTGQGASAGGASATGSRRVVRLN